MIFQSLFQAKVIHLFMPMVYNIGIQIHMKKKHDIFRKIIQFNKK